MFFKLVFTTGIVLVEPHLRVFLGNHGGHEAGEERVTRVVRGGGQDTVTNRLLLHVIVVVQQRIDAAPLVVAQVVDDKQERGFVLAEMREQLLFQHRMRLYRSVGAASVHPVEVIALHKLGKLYVGLLLLGGQHLGYAFVLYLLHLQFPIHQFAVQILPFLHGKAVGNAHGEVAERLLVIDRHLGGHEFFIVNVLLQTQQNLVGIHGFDEVIGDTGADGVLHNVFLLAFGNHHDGEMGVVFLQSFQGFQAAQTGHILIQKYDVHKLFLQNFKCFRAAERGDDLVAFGVQKQDMGLQQINLVVRPQNFSVHTSIFKFNRRITRVAGI